MNETFDLEYSKLSDLIAHATSHDLTIAEIVSTYHQIIHVSSMCTALRDKTDNLKITQTEEMITNFVRDVQPKILANLDTSIRTMTTALENDPQSGSFDDLRAMMSTREFVTQYQRL